MARADQVLVWAGKVPTEAPTWTDAYGRTRTAAEMTTDHLWNVMAYIREHTRYAPPGGRWHFYRAAASELKRRRIIP